MELFLLCLKIFFVRILDVSLGTLRTMFVVKEKRLLAASIGFIEALIWFLIVREALTVSEPSIFIAVAYASGFSCGTFVGSSLSKKLILGKIMIQVYSNLEDDSLVKAIRENGYGITVLSYKGLDDSKDGKLLNISVDKKEQKKLQKLIKKHDPNAFIVINETKYVENGYFK